MGTRSIEEIQKDIELYEKRKRDLHNKFWCRNMYRYRPNTMAIYEANRIIRRIENLRLELNRANQKKWGTRQ